MLDEVRRRRAHPPPHARRAEPSTLARKRHEPGSAEEIQTFCSTTYGVTLPDVREGRSERPPRVTRFYKDLTAIADASGTAGDIQWNFEKFLVSADGKSIQRFDRRRPRTIRRSSKRSKRPFRSKRRRSAPRCSRDRCILVGHAYRRRGLRLRRARPARILRNRRRADLQGAGRTRRSQDAGAGLSDNIKHKTREVACARILRVRARSLRRRQARDRRHATHHADGARPRAMARARGGRPRRPHIAVGMRRIACGGDRLLLFGGTTVYEARTERRRSPRASSASTAGSPRYSGEAKNIRGKVLDAHRRRRPALFRPTRVSRSSAK